MHHKPIQTILFLTPLVALMFLAPWVDRSLFQDKEKIEEIPAWSELLEQDSIFLEDEILDTLQVDTLKIDTTEANSTIVDTLVIDLNRWQPKYAHHSTSTLPDSLKFKGSHKSFEKLHKFFEELEFIRETDTQPLEIFHWGDSQIEGDRISGVIRSSWQKSWGGSGPGLLPAVQPIPSLSIRQEHSGNWTRYTRFGEIDSTLEHSAFGPMAAFCLVKGDGEITLRPHPSGFKLNKVWPRIKFNIGAAPLGGNITLTGRTNQYRSFNIRPASTAKHQEIIANLDEGETELAIGFEGYNMEITGIELGSESGVQIHNIPMRGSAGMIFSKLDKGHLTKTIENRNVGLVILQFGGNVVPYIRDVEAANRYGRRFAKQLGYLKSIIPETPFIVIGPSDMGENETYPMLDAVIESLEKSALDEDCLFWDLRRVMGGDGAMMSWAEAEPKLASPDLIHFTPKGARIIGERLDMAIRAEYKSWIEWRR